MGMELKDQHVKQAVDYAANQGVEWVGLTNVAIWRPYRVQLENRFRMTWCWSSICLR